MTLLSYPQLKIYLYTPQHHSVTWDPMCYGCTDYYRCHTNSVLAGISNTELHLEGCSNILEMALSLTTTRSYFYPDHNTPPTLKSSAMLCDCFMTKQVLQTATSHHCIDSIYQLPQSTLCILVLLLLLLLLLLSQTRLESLSLLLLSWMVQR